MEYSEQDKKNLVIALVAKSYDSNDNGMTKLAKIDAAVLAANEIFDTLSDIPHEAFENI